MNALADDDVMGKTTLDGLTALDLARRVRKPRPFSTPSIPLAPREYMCVWWWRGGGGSTDASQCRHCEHPTTPPRAASIARRARIHPSHSTPCSLQTPPKRVTWKAAFEAIRDHPEVLAPICIPSTG
jgi:hypothetical protein